MSLTSYRTAPSRDNVECVYRLGSGVARDYRELSKIMLENILARQNICPVTRTSEMVSNSFQDLRDVLDDCRVGFRLATVRMSDTVDWDIRDGAMQHRTGGFFSVSGVARNDGSAPVIMLYQPQSAVTGILSTMIDGERHFLFQGRAEPGCMDDVQFGPTVQSTPANYLRAHGGKSTPYINEFIQQATGHRLLEDSSQLDLGERYLFKTKRSIHIQVDKALAELPSFTWTSRAAIAQSAHQSTFLNTDLRSLLSVVRWSDHEDDGELRPRNGDICKSLSAPVRPDTIGHVMARISEAALHNSKLVPVQDAPGWRVDRNGLHNEHGVQGFDVVFQSVSARMREVTSWVQPLINSQTHGTVVLACRDNKGILEFFVQALRETGLCTSVGLAPSYLRYQGDAGAPPDWLVPSMDQKWSESLESDEGGRFFQDASTFSVVKCGSLPVEPDTKDGAWVRLSELKFFLAQSNICTIQLRGIVSHLLAVE